MTQPAESFPLPSQHHVPGRNERHRDDLFDAIKALCPAHTCHNNAADNVAWRYGLRLFNAGYHWEAHEVLETVWMRAEPNSRERSLVQAVIHIANGALKLAMQRPGAAARLSQLAAECAKRAFSGWHGSLMGLQAANLVRAADCLATGKAPPSLVERYAI